VPPVIQRIWPPCKRLVRKVEKFLCLLWQHCCRPWSFTREPCSFDNGRTGFVWERRVSNGTADTKSRQMRGAFHHTISQRIRWTSSGNSQTNCCCLWQRYESAKCDEEGNISRGKSSTTMMRCKKKSWHVSKGRRHTSMTRGYRSWFQDNKCLDNPGDYVEK